MNEPCSHFTDNKLDAWVSRGILNSKLNNLRVRILRRITGPTLLLKMESEKKTF